MLINQREYTLLNSLANELNIKANTNLLFNLNYLTTLVLRGEASRAVLQGQLSCDIREVTPTQMRQGALCTLQGRVQALIDVIEYDNTLHLIVARDLAPFVMKALQKPAMLSRVSIVESTDYQIFGFYAPNSTTQTPLAWHMPDTRFNFSQQHEGAAWCVAPQLSMLLIKNQYAAEGANTFIANEALRGSLAWHSLCLTRSGRAHV